MIKKVNELSVFFPFWNEEKNIERVITEAQNVAKDVATNWEILIVDDGSSDKTLSIARQIANKDKHIHVITHNPNRGYGAALKEGLEHAKYDLVVFADGDGQFDFAEVTNLLEAVDEKTEMVIGFRTKRNDHNIGKRLLLMNLLKAWDFILFHFYFRDIDCGFKLFTRGAIEKLLPLRSEGAMITTEILAKAKKKKIKIKEVGVTHYPRKFGAQTGANLPVIIRAVLESLILWYDLHYGRA